jgi:predicted regulator of Ras-like GTPase activity (Roadblock/LC7/MglB family)
LSEPDKISSYAILTAAVHDACQDLAEQFRLGTPEAVIIEGDDVKVLCLGIGENKIGIFMEKCATHAWIIKRILL